jgi:8-oxo-dGTP pyrophosphatase MutT (NUDIX family)
MEFTNSNTLSSEIVILSNTKSIEECELYKVLSNTFPNVIIISSIDYLNASYFIRCVIFDTDSCGQIDISWIRRLCSKTFIVIYQPNASTNPELRLAYFDAGANMVAHDYISIINTLSNAVLSVGRSGGNLICPYCDYRCLTENELWHHMPAYHINCPNETKRVTCPICSELTHTPLQVHIHEQHGPYVKRHMNSHRTKLYSFSLVVCRHPITGSFLLCQEFANQGFWLPGGAVDPGESLTNAARRETMEEAGIDVELKGILAIEHTPSINNSTGESFVRMRVIFYAEPVDVMQLPKSSPDFESAGACWCSYDQILRGMKLRGKEPVQWAR